MLEFPLCSLSYPGNDKYKVGMIISFCIVENSKKIKTNVEERIDSLLSEKNKPAGFNKNYPEHRRLWLSADELKIMLGDVYSTIESHREIHNHISKFELKYGKDAYCRVGKGLCFETRDGIFPYRQFAVLCAIQSILGKSKKFKRITKNRIRYAVLGYKSESVAMKEKINIENLLSDRQIGIIIDVLHSKQFFSKFTYANRQTFFSTRLMDKDLHEAVKKSKVYWAKKKSNEVDKTVTEEIKRELKLIKFNGMYGTGTG